MIIALLAIYALIAAGMILYQRKLMYFPHTDLLAPAQYGLDHVKAGKLKTKDGELLDFWHLPAADGRPTILYFHGNGGHLGFRANFFRAAADAGYGVWMLSYRGFGTSTGSPSETGLYIDAEAAYQYLRQDLQLADDQIILFGESLGTGVATHVAQGKKLRSLVLQAPFTSVVGLASEIYWWLPVNMMLKDRYDSISKTANVQMPTLILAAEKDRVVPARHAKRLFEVMHDPKKFVMFSGVGHNDFDPQLVLRELRNFDGD